ncbi:MAG: T9SS type A sorting domain-containing protein, partial [Ignavibacteria bacterium]|nr:T9SS type A sorting domain-containing protein [Ignavibacteria bacterium]
GFFYHLLDPATATRTWNSELSSIDASLCLAGVIFAREYFNASTDPVEMEIRRLGDSVYHRFDWRWMLKSPDNVFYMAWKPESGFDVYTWDYLTDETILVCLLAIGSGQVDPSVFYAWPRILGSYHGFTCYQTWWGSLFTNFFAQCWIPGEQLGLDRGQPIPVNWWQNSATAALASRQFCIDSSVTYRTYGDNSWGLTACFGPTGYNGGVDKSYGGAPLGDWPPNHDGTIAPYGAGSSIGFFSRDPSLNLSVQALRNYYNNYPKLWGLYGLKDAYNLGGLADTTDDWYTDDYVGIDSGPLLVMIENYRSGLVWNYFTRNAHISSALKLIFQDTLASVSVAGATIPYSTKLEQNYPNPFNPETKIQFSIVNTQFTILKVYDLLGREVAVLLNEQKAPGSYEVNFDARLRAENSGGQAAGLASGVYLYRLKAGNFVQTRKMILIR